MQGLLKLSDFLGDFVTLIGRAAAWLAVPMMVIILFDVLMRKVYEVIPSAVEWSLAPSSTKLQELEWHLHATLFLLCLGFAYIKDAHVRVELVREKLRPRTRAWIELIGSVLFLVPYCYIVLRYGWDFAARSYSLNEVSSALTGLPYRWIIKAMMPVGFVFLALAGISVALRNFVYLFGPDDLRGASGTYAEADHIEELKHVAEEELEEDLQQHPEHRLGN